MRAFLSLQPLLRSSGYTILNKHEETVSKKIMKRILIVALAVLAVAPLARAEDKPKKKKAKAQAVEVAQSSSKHSREKQKNQTIGQANPTAAGQAKVATRNDRTVVVNKDVRKITTGQRHFLVKSANQVSFNDARRFDWRRRHDRGWWRSNNVQIVLYGGGYWFWNNGWWYPAYGYDSRYSNYVYDGPIFGYGNVAPGEVTAEVQQALARQGYYRGPIDGILGGMTRGSIERFQADHGLVATATIDEPTLAYLGLA